ncbi:MBL fold metallo-hydrolase [Streptomyces sp. P3]|uniref:MBL fold metallo-hydrolase n=1 Tax=Streptomyces sp. P3 TaxID=2135430 RepID=UPI00131F2F68|nr:MBL fold metallo-hydrolase [Streptomyces sp. P3]
MNANGAHENNDAPATANLNLKVFVSPTNPIGKTGLTFSPTTSSLIYGEREVVLVDAQYLKRDVADLADTIDALDRTLTTIFITHGHADHYFGIGELVQRFPGVRVVSTREVVADIAVHGAEQEEAFSAWFGDDLVMPTTPLEPLDEDGFTIEGHRLNVLPVDQADMSPVAALHVPQLDAVIAGDLAYNGIHQYLAATGPDEWVRWAASVDAVAALQPKIVVAGHRKPEASDHDGAAILANTREYLRDFTRLAAQVATAPELIEAMQARYPDHGNPATLMVSAQHAKSADVVDPARP